MSSINKGKQFKKKSTAIDLYLFCLESSSCSNCISVLRAYTISAKGTHKIIKYLFFKEFFDESVGLARSFSRALIPRGRFPRRRCATYFKVFNKRRLMYLIQL